MPSIRPAPTVGGAAIIRASRHMRRFRSNRRHSSLRCIMFATPPCVELGGPARLRCGCGSPDAPDTDFTAKLTMSIRRARISAGLRDEPDQGLLRVRYRDSWERPAPMVPGEV
jgi:hypothetical protein